VAQVLGAIFDLTPPEQCQRALALSAPSAVRFYPQSSGGLPPR
jgi:hypothetical protein